MGEREALLRAVCENPDDDLPRLVFADWLEEHGEPERAEFIRMQCQLAEAWRLGQGIDPVQRDRESLLWVRYKKRWMSELPIRRGVTWHPFFSRGFAYALNVTKWQRLRAVVSKVFSAAPITVMRVGMVSEATELVAAIRTLRLVSLDLSGAGLDDAAVREILGAELMKRVRQLDLRGNPISAGVQRELAAEHGGRVLVGDIEYVPL